MNKIYISFAFTIIYTFSLRAQFAGNASDKNSTTAVHSDSSIIIDWAKTCTVERGPMDISNPELGLASAGEANNAIGKASGSSIVSLGDGGSATLSFDPAIANGYGYDFAVFENSFSDSFLELAHVEVSSDGINFFRFPSISNTSSDNQVDGFGSIDATKIHNLAGKYRVFYGTPFDLDELKDLKDLNIMKITHVKIVDVIGSIDENFGSKDSKGNLINDPFPTSFSSGGFDLDAIGVIHNSTTVNSFSISNPIISIYPNPVLDKLNIQSDFPIQNVYITNLLGNIMYQEANMYTSHIEIALNNYKKGIYLVYIQQNNNYYTTKILVQ
jgi:hypothetical protein